jgi:uncharacterized damage-inducible protein DinB
MISDFFNSLLGNNHDDAHENVTETPATQSLPRRTVEAFDNGTVKYVQPTPEDTTPDPLRYPIGRYRMPDEITIYDIENYMSDIETLPKRLMTVISMMPSAKLDETYREGGWTVRQVVHHLADSHMNGFMRLKLALTEEQPVIKPFNERMWADLEDAKLAPAEISVLLLEALHRRWVILMKSLSTRELEKTYYHPERKRIFRLDELISLYSWHGNHHLAQIQLVADGKAQQIAASAE